MADDDGSQPWEIPGFLEAHNAGLTISGVPAAIQPLRALGVAIDSLTMEDNSVTGGAFFYSAEVQINGNIVFTKGGNSTGFTSSNIKGVAGPLVIAYPLL